MSERGPSFQGDIGLDDIFFDQTKCVDKNKAPHIVPVTTTTTTTTTTTVAPTTTGKLSTTFELSYLSQFLFSITYHAITFRLIGF